MSVSTTTSKFSPATIYRLFKYLIYCLLASNIFFFFYEEYLDSLELYGLLFPGWNTIDAYAATIDTFSWVVLLLLFELETAVLTCPLKTVPVTKLENNLNWSHKEATHAKKTLQTRRSHQTPAIS